MSTVEIIKEFREILENIEILYNDCVWGFHGNRESIENLENTDEASKIEMLVFLRSSGIVPIPNPIEFLDHPAPYNYGAINGAESRRTKHFTLRKFKLRNSSGGENYRFVGNMCVVQVFEYWENHYRNKIAISQNKKKDDIQIDVFDDLRHLRQAILHHKGIATKKVAKASILKWFKDADTIYFQPENIKEIFNLVFQELDLIVGMK